MNPDTRLLLERVSVATLATALFKRGLRRQTIQNVRPLAARGHNMVGPAFTLRYIPAREDLNTISVFTDPAHPQRVAVEECPPGAVLVVDSRKDPAAASAGSILVKRLELRGVAGIVTDGGLRDSPEIAASGFAAYHQQPSAPTNLTLHQAIEIDCPIGCGDAPVFPGDIVVGDDEAAIVIPAELADEIALEATQMTLFEQYVMERVVQGHSIVGLYPPTSPQVQPDFEQWRSNQR